MDKDFWLSMVDRTVFSLPPKLPIKWHEGMRMASTINSSNEKIGEEMAASKKHLALARRLSWLEGSPHVPRLQVRSPVRAHTRINQRMHKSVGQQIDVSLSVFPSLKSISKNFQKRKV